MKWRLIFACVLVVLFFGAGISQENQQEQRFYTEAPIEFRDGFLYSVQITIAFQNHLVIQNLEGNERINGNQIQESSFKNCLANFCAHRNIAMGNIFIKRGIPSWPLAKSTVTDMTTGEVKPAVDLSLVHILRFPQMVDVEALCESLKRTEGIAYAHPPALIGLLAEPNDPFYSEQWYLDKISAPKAWDISKGINTVRIAIIDAQAVCQTHPDLNPPPPSEGKIKGGDGKTRTIGDEWNRHGTMVAGVAAALTNNNEGIAGLGWNNELITYETPTGKETNDHLLAEAINAAAQPTNKVHVINLSFHIGKPCNSHYSFCKKKPIYSTRIIQEGLNGDFPEIEGAISNAINSGIVVVAAGGNIQREFYCGGESTAPPYNIYCKKGEDDRYGPIWPAAYPGVIGVSGTNESDELASSYDPVLDETAIYNHGSHIDVCAPAKNIKSTQPPDGYFTADGTSFSAPLVAAEAALIRSVNPTLTVSEVESIIEQSADKVAGMGGLPWTEYYGHGRINAYQALLLALAYANKTPNISPTIYNNQRILARGQNSPATVLHEVFAAGVSESYEVFYRRSSNNGSSWDLTTRLSSGAENNRQPCLTITDEGTPDGVHVVWQTKKTNGKYKVYYRKSTNTGASWSDPVLLADDITCSTYQSAGPMPVITSISYLSSYKLIVVWVSSTGLKYRTAYNDQWATMGALDDGSYNDDVWFPSLMGKDNWASLTYDTRFYGVYSRIFNGAWSSRTRVDQTTTIYDRASQTAITIGSETAAVWSARPSAGGNYRICFRMGNSNNTWNDQYNEFGHTNLDALYPAVMVYNPPQDYCHAVVYHTSDNQVRLQIKDIEGGNWNGYNPGSNNRFANITSVHLNTPKMIWVGNQSSATGPYPIELSQQYLPKTTQTNNWVYHRRADIKNNRDSTALSVEWGEIEVITKTGEPMALEFVPCKQGINLGLNASNVMDYLATIPVSLPATAEQLRFHYHVFTSCQQDTSEQKVTTAFTHFEVTFRLTDLTFGKSYPIPNTFADARGAINDQQDIIVDVQNMRGSSIVIKPEINGLPIEEEQFSYALGHIYIEKDKTLPKPLPPDLRILEPETFALFQNYPNPFNPETEICYQLAQDTHVTLKIYNLLGQEVRTLVDKEELAGHYTVRWNGKDENGLNVASGVYLYHITMGNFMATRKMILLR